MRSLLSKLLRVGRVVSLLPLAWATTQCVLAAEIAERPDWKVGDKWQYHARIDVPQSEFDWSREVREVLAVPDSIVNAAGVAQLAKYRVATQTGQTLTFDAESNSLDRRGAEYSWRRFNFPLQVGKRWDHNYNYENSSFQGLATSSWEVKTYEKLVVPAGTFDCFRVEGTEWKNYTYLLGPGGASVGQGYTVTTYWYCPAIKWVAKWHVISQFWRMGNQSTTTSELTSFTAAQ